MYGSGVFYSGIGYAIGTVLSELFLLPVYEQLGIISIYQVGSLFLSKNKHFSRFGIHGKSLILELFSVIQYPRAKMSQQLRKLHKNCNV